MRFPYQPEKREYLRIPTAVPVQYKFVSPDHFKVSTEPLDGVTVDLSMGGVQIIAVLPSDEYIMPLLMQKMALILSVKLPGESEPVYAIGRVAWIDAIEGEDPKKYAIGLRLHEISSADVDRIFEYIVHSQFF